MGFADVKHMTSLHLFRMQLYSVLWVLMNARSFVHLLAFSLSSIVGAAYHVNKCDRV